MATCNCCGEYFYPRRKYKNGKLLDNYYFCNSKRRGSKSCGNRSINITKLEHFIWNRFFIDESFKNKIKLHLKESDNSDKISSVEGNIKLFKARLNNLQQQRSRVIQSVSKGLISDEDIRGEMDRIKAEKSTYEVKLFNAEQEMVSIQEMKSKSNTIMSELMSLKDNAPHNTKKEIINKYIKNILIQYIDGVHYLVITFNISIPNEYYYMESHKIDYVAVNLLNGMAVTNVDGAYPNDGGCESTSTGRELVDWIECRLYMEKNCEQRILYNDDVVDSEGNILIPPNLS